jgi:hypothetical protein
MQGLQRRNLFLVLETPQCPLMWFISSINIGIISILGEISVSMMSMIPEKLKTAMKGDIWRKRIRK